MPKQTKVKILQAALDEFAAKGLAGARVDRIAQVAGVNKAMIYYYFTSKEQLFDELFQTELEQFQQELGFVLARTDITTLEGATQATREILEYIGCKKKLLSVLMAASLRDESIQMSLFKLLDFTTAQGIEIVQQTGRTPDGYRQEALLNELFTGLLPLILFVLLRDGLKINYGWDEAELNERFIANWVRQHAGF